MKLRHLHIYAPQYLINLPAILFHELCHWLFAMPFWAFGMISFPRIVIDKLFRVEESENDEEFSLTYYWHSAYCEYSGDPGMRVIPAITASGPLFGLIGLILVLPLWMYPVLLCSIGNLFLSVSDMRTVCNLFKRYPNE